MAVLSLTFVTFAVFGLCLGCGGRLRGPSGDITTPNYPDNYPNNANCNWYIDVEEDSIIKITFTDFKLEGRSIGACADYVKLYDNSAEMGPYCGEENPGVYYSSGRSLRIQFVTDDTVTDRGFYVEYDELDKDERPDSTTPGPTTTTTEGPPPSCDETIVADSGTITSPNYPSNYPNLVECRYKMQLLFGGTMTLTFEDFELEEDENCKNDYVVIYDGEDDKAREMARFCGRKTYPITSTGDALYMKFISDVSDTFRGFMASFEKNTDPTEPPTEPSTEPTLPTEPPTLPTEPPRTATTAKARNTTVKQH